MILQGQLLVGLPRFIARRVLAKTKLRTGLRESRHEMRRCAAALGAWRHSERSASQIRGARAAGVGDERATVMMQSEAFVYCTQSK